MILKITTQIKFMIQIRTDLKMLLICVKTQKLFDLKSTL